MPTQHIATYRARLAKVLRHVATCLLKFDHFVSVHMKQFKRKKNVYMCGILSSCEGHEHSRNRNTFPSFNTKTKLNSIRCLIIEQIF